MVRTKHETYRVALLILDGAGETDEIIYDFKEIKEYLDKYEKNAKRAGKKGNSAGSGTKHDK